MLHSGPCPCARKSIALSAALLVAYAGMFVLFFYGDPQWCRFIYLFQARFTPKRLEALESRYTGTWRTWHPNGKLRSVKTLVNGRLIGQWTRWDAEGRIMFKWCTDEAGFLREFRSWFTNGKPALIAACKSGKLHGRVLRRNSAGKIIADGIYIDDSPYEGTFLIDGNLKCYSAGKEVVPTQAPQYGQNDKTQRKKTTNPVKIDDGRKPRDGRNAPQ